jgi:hypothetical protein
MKKKVKTKNMKTREETSHPYLAQPIEDRLISSDAIDLTDNHKITVDGHYIIIKPIDGSKKFKKKK